MVNEANVIKTNIVKIPLDKWKVLQQYKLATGISLQAQLDTAVESAVKKAEKYLAKVG